MNDPFDLDALMDWYTKTLALSLGVDIKDMILEPNYYDLIEKGIITEDIIEQETYNEFTKLKYKVAYDLVLTIEYTLQKSLHHWRTKSGRLLRTLDQVVNAILMDDLCL